MKLKFPSKHPIPLGQIEGCFAWLPVVTNDGYFCWLDSVYRKRVHWMYEGDGWDYYANKPQPTEPD